MLTRFKIIVDSHKMLYCHVGCWIPSIHSEVNAGGIFIAQLKKLLVRQLSLQNCAAIVLLIGATLWDKELLKRRLIAKFLQLWVYLLVHLFLNACVSWAKGTEWKQYTFPWFVYKTDRLLVLKHVKLSVDEWILVKYLSAETCPKSREPHFVNLASRGMMTHFNQRRWFPKDSFWWRLITFCVDD